MKCNLSQFFEVAVFISLFSAAVLAETDHAHHDMAVNTQGAVMNQNRTSLPRDCETISKDYSFTVHAGKDYASNKPGTIFGLSTHELQVEPCSRIEITFINEDAVRHQWMVHGLPRYLYPAGMFHIEAEGGQTRSGTFIVPGEHRNYLIHCDMAQHMEKGMRGQLIVGAGSGDLWAIPGSSGQLIRDTYWPSRMLWLIAILAILAGGFAVRLIGQTTRD
ncbi:MAG: cupredoxin domain-containing protein [Gammaproteobacteria bacterium]